MTHPEVTEAAEALGRGDLGRAQRLCTEALRLRQDDPLCWRILGAAHAAGGDLTAARQALTRSLALEPHQAEAVLELARVDMAEGRGQEALSGFRKAAQMDDRPEILVKAGEGIGNLGGLDEAQALFRRALEKAPSMAAARFNLGLARLAVGAAEEGRQLFAEVVAAHPELAAAWLHLGGALNALGRYGEAIAAFEKVLERVPGDARALAWMGASLQFLGDFDGAERCYREALARAPDSADAHANLGKLLQSQDRPAEAEEHFRRALRIQPGHASALSGLAARLDNQGRCDEALKLLEDSVGAAGAFQLAPIHARVLRRLGRPVEAREILERVAAQPRLPADARIQLDFSLAAVADEIGDYDDAWAHAMKANRRRRDLLPAGTPEADLTAMQTAVEELEATFSEAAVPGLPDSGCPSERPIFIVGMPRSGKSLAEQILSSHPAVHGGGEMTVLGEASRRFAERAGRWPGCAPRLDIDVLRAEADRYLEAIGPGAASQALHVTDCMPFNFVHLGLIRMLFPRARIIHCVRHPLDLVLRCYFKNFAGRSLSFAFDLDDIVRYYLLYRELMDHWARVGIAAHMLRYESLVTDPAAETGRLLEFLGLRWDEDCLRFHEPGVATSSADTPVRRPLNDREVGGWQHYRAQLAEAARKLPVAEYERGQA